MPHAFISYSHEDRLAAESVRGCLQAAGFTVWWDQNLVAGQIFNQAIHNELNSADAIVVLWSERSVRSPYVQAEALFAFDRLRLIPLRIEDCALLYPFAILQTIDIRVGGWCERLNQAVSLVAQQAQQVQQREDQATAEDDPLEVAAALLAGDLVDVVQDAACKGEIRSPFRATDVQTYLRARNFPEQRIRYVPQMLANHREGNQHPTTGRPRFRRVAWGLYEAICLAIP